MIDMKLYEDINRLYPIESMSLDSNSMQDPLSPPSRSRGNWFKKLFKFKRQVRVCTYMSRKVGGWLVRGRRDLSW